MAIFAIFTICDVINIYIMFQSIIFFINNILSDCEILLDEYGGFADSTNRTRDCL